MGIKNTFRFVPILLLLALTSCSHEDPEEVTKKMYEYLGKKDIATDKIASVSLREFSPNNEWFPHTWTGVALSLKYDGFCFNVYYDERTKELSDDYRQKLIGLKKSLYEIDTLGSSLDFVKRSVNDAFKNEYSDYECKIIFLNEYEAALEFYLVKSINQNSKEAEVKKFMGNYAKMKLGLIKVTKLTVNYFSESQFVKSEVEDSLIMHLKYYGTQCGLLYLEGEDLSKLNDSVIVSKIKIFKCEE